MNDFYVNFVIPVWFGFEFTWENWWLFYVNMSYSIHFVIDKFVWRNYFVKHLLMFYYMLKGYKVYVSVKYRN